jgi:hypothetical protein
VGSSYRLIPQRVTLRYTPSTNKKQRRCSVAGARVSSSRKLGSGLTKRFMALIVFKMVVYQTEGMFKLSWSLSRVMGGAFLFWNAVCWLRVQVRTLDCENTSFDLKVVPKSISDEIHCIVVA